MDNYKDAKSRWGKLYLCFLIILFLTGCSQALRNKGGNLQTMQVPVYERKTMTYPLEENANTYMIRCSPNGFFYYVMGTKDKVNGENNDTPENEYRFYFQPYEGGQTSLYCTITEGYVRDFSVSFTGSEPRLSVLVIGEVARILRFDGLGSKPVVTVIGNEFNDLEGFPKLLNQADGGYVIGMGDQVTFLDKEGKTTKVVRVSGEIRKFFAADASGFFVLSEKNEAGHSKRFWEKGEIKNSIAEVMLELPDDAVEAFPFEDGYVIVWPDRITLCYAEREEEEILVDLNAQGLLASQIQSVFGNKNELKLVSFDPSESKPELRLYLLTKKRQQEADEEKDSRLFTPDGRRIVSVAIPESCLFQIEFHAKKYNQTQDDSFIQVERFEGALEDYLGKGNRPDVIMFSDHVEIEEYVGKNLLVNLLPMYEAWEKSELEGMIPNCMEILGAGRENAMYAMASRFRLLLRTSDGQELDENGKCDIINYLKWYDTYLSDGDYVGMGTLEYLLYAMLPFYYEESNAEAFFDSSDFKKLMAAYKEVYERHQGKLVLREESNLAREIVRGPRWYATYNRPELSEPMASMEGLPGPYGENLIYVRLEDPMSILNTSECQKEAFDFMAYYMSLAEPLVKGDKESSYGKGGNTWAFFSVWEKYLREEIYESKRPYMSAGGKEIFFTEEQCEHLKEMITNAIPDTRTQRVLYEMLMEEMDGYFQGGKELNSACEALQGRAVLYLLETKR